MIGSSQEIKHNVTPNRYYSTVLNGSFGKATGQGWYNWNGLCSFHADRKAGSFVINKTTGAFKCFSCGASGGDIIAFHMKAHSLNFKEALKQLQERFNA